METDAEAPAGRPMPHMPRTFDDLTVGEVFRSRARRVSRQDIQDFARLSGDYTALHTDDDYAATTHFGSVVSHGVLNLAIATGLSYELGIFEGTVLAVRSTQATYERPVRPDDELTLELEVSALEPNPRPGRGRADFQTRLINQDGRRVLGGTWTLLLRRR
jgi:acyl dehydratase